MVSTFTYIIITEADVAIDFFSLSKSYRENVSDAVQNRIALVAEELTSEYLFSGKGELLRIYRKLLERGISVSKYTVCADKEALRIAYRYLNSDTEARCIIHQMIDKKDRRCFGLQHLLFDEISWSQVRDYINRPLLSEGVECRKYGIDRMIRVGELVGERSGPRLVVEPAELAEFETALTEESEAETEVDPEEHECTEGVEEEIPTFKLLCLAREEFEHLKRAAAISVNVMERLFEENEKLRKDFYSCNLRLAVLEEQLTGVRRTDLGGITELNRLIEFTDKIDKERNRKEKLFDALPIISSYHGNREIIYEDRFLNSFLELQEEECGCVVQQMNMLCSNPKHPSLGTKKIWHNDLPGTPNDSKVSRAGDFRFTWRVEDNHIKVFGIYRRESIYGSHK